MDGSIESVCRLCGEERKCSFNVFVKYEEHIVLCDLIKDTLNILISEDDNIPTEICLQCKTYLVNFFNFRETARKTQLLLVDVKTNLLVEAATSNEQTYSIMYIKSEESVDCDYPTEEPSQRSFSSDNDIPLNKVAEEYPIIKTEPTIPKHEEEHEEFEEFTPTQNGSCESSRESSIENPSGNFETTLDNLNHPEECHVCHKRFTKERYLRIHLKRTHKIAVESNYPCDKCTQKFMQKETFERHRKLHDDPELNKPVTCDICGKSYFSDKALKTHVRNVHCDGERKFVCEVCGALYRTRSNLRDHKVSHTGEFPYKCSKCDRRFQTRSNLGKHLDIHSETPYICSICHMQSTTRRGLRRHMIKHLDQKPHQCTMCGNSYKRAAALRQHLVVHSGIRPYSCNFCEQTFADGSNKRIHMKRVHKKEFAEMETLGIKFTPAVLPHLKQLKEELL